MEWTPQHDRALLDEMSVSEVFQYKKGTPERGQVWDSIAANLNAVEYPKFKVLKRSCRDRWTLLRGKYQKKMTNEIKASGIDVEVNEIDSIIEELIGKEDAAVSTGGKDKKKVEEEKKAAEQIRKKAMERLGESSKRCGADGEVEVKKKKRKSSSEAVEFLREKAKLDHSLREEELQLRKDRQSQTLVLLQQQQQMNEVLLSLMEKMVEKQKKLEQFIYRFTPVRCLLISILKGCNTVFLLNFKRRLLILKCLHMSCLVALALMGKVISQFVILTQTVNNQLLSLSWGVLFFPFTFEGSGEG